MHILLRWLAYLVLAFFCLGMVQDYARFMLKGLIGPDRRLYAILTAAMSAVLVLIFVWVIWMMPGPGGCS